MHVYAHHRACLSFQKHSHLRALYVISCIICISTIHMYRASFQLPSGPYHQMSGSDDAKDPQFCVGVPLLIIGIPLSCMVGSFSSINVGELAGHVSLFFLSSPFIFYFLFYQDLILFPTVIHLKLSQPQASITM